MRRARWAIRMGRHSVAGLASSTIGLDLDGIFLPDVSRDDYAADLEAALARRAAPAPMMLPVMVCVVDTGMPSSDAVNTMIEPPVDAANP